MSFQVADLQGTVGENLIGDSNTDLIFSKAPPSFIHKLSAKDVQIPAPTDTIKDSDPQTYPTAGKKENEPPSSKAYLPPHLRTSKDSNHNSGTGTRTHAHHPGNSKGSLPEATAKVTDSSPVKYTIDKVEPKVTTSSAGAKPLTHPSPVVENLENKIFFNAWPKLEDRGRAGMFSHNYLFQWLLTRKQPPRYARSSSKISLVARQLRS